MKKDVERTSGGTPFFPSLRKIMFSDVDFDPSRIDSKKLVKDLTKTLSKRPEEYAVEEIGLYNCINFEEEDCDMLEEVVGIVDWDGDENMQGPESEDEDEFDDSSDMDELARHDAFYLDDDYYY